MFARDDHPGRVFIFSQVFILRGFKFNKSQLLISGELRIGFL